MSNYFTLFCTTLSNLSPEEKSWIEAWLKARAAQDEDGDVGFEWAVEVGHNQLPYLHIYTEDLVGGDYRAVATFIQEFLKTWRPHETFTMEWAEVGDSPGAIDGFTGGAMRVTAWTQRFYRLSDFMKEETITDPIREAIGNLEALYPAPHLGGANPYLEDLQHFSPTTHLLIRLNQALIALNQAPSPLYLKAMELGKMSVQEAGGQNRYDFVKAIQGMRQVLAYLEEAAMPLIDGISENPYVEPGRVTLVTALIALNESLTALGQLPSKLYLEAGKVFKTLNE
ncbi:MAG: hypothetical protein KJ077_47735 [Anaerolineae bacterium]|nr:hypothetical protein [Anaerolineae bacterium]